MAPLRRAPVLRLIEQAALVRHHLACDVYPNRAHGHTVLGAVPP